MVELTCPLCGKPVRVPKIEIHTIFVCKKCHSPFHLNASKQAVLGDPPDVDCAGVRLPVDRNTK